MRTLTVLVTVLCNGTEGLMPAWTSCSNKMRQLLHVILALMLVPTVGYHFAPYRFRVNAQEDRQIEMVWSYTAGRKKGSF